MFEYKTARDLVNMLASTVNDSYNFPDEISKWEKVGLVISKLTNIPQNVFSVIYSALENWNHHAENTFLSVFFSEYFQHITWSKKEIIDQSILERFSREISITDYKDGEWKIVGKAKVRIIVEYEENK